MQQVKLFKSIEAEVGTLEAEINEWIRESGARIISLDGNIAPQTGALAEQAGAQMRYPPSDLFVLMLYETQ
ncbi:MAG: hypothetical protein IID44_10955 [Planctomycetes bacterium]|nr:hypothetical protein [Planctomycetota bacterium]